MLYDPGGDTSDQQSTEGTEAASANNDQVRLVVIGNCYDTVDGMPLLPTRPEIHTEAG